MTNCRPETIAYEEATRKFKHCTCGGMKREPMPCDYCHEYERVRGLAEGDGKRESFAEFVARHRECPRCGDSYTIKNDPGNKICYGCQDADEEAADCEENPSMGDST